jgi:hypothetical protein
MQKLSYEDIRDRFIAMKNRKYAGFVQFYYIDQKSQKEIMDRMFINNRWTYYKIKQRVKKQISSRLKDDFIFSHAQYDSYGSTNTIR